MEKSKKYWEDYTYFLNKVNKLTNSSPAELLEFYTSFVTSLEIKDFDNYKMFEYELDNDFYFRTLIQYILAPHELQNNELLVEFKAKVTDLDERIKPFLSTNCANRSDWFKKIELNPEAFN